jgi:hypothetical protein
MPDLELIRSAEDRRTYVLEGVGTIRFGGWRSRGAEAQAAGRTWQFTRRGLFSPVTEASDAAGTVVGHYAGRAIRRGGELRWHDRSLRLRPSSAWRQRYALADGDRELALFDGKGWGRRPVIVTVPDAASLDPALILFAAFVVHRLAEDANTAAASGATAAGVAAAGS